MADALAETGRILDDLNATEGTKLAVDTLRAVIGALPAPTPRDMRLAIDIAAAAGIIDAAAGTSCPSAIVPKVGHGPTNARRADGTAP